MTSELSAAADPVQPVPPVQPARPVQPVPPLTIAVLGARDSAAPEVAAALEAAAATGVPAGPPGTRTRDIRVMVDATPADRPDAAVLVVDAVCPVRPDDVEIARGVASRLPLAVALAGRADTCTSAALSATVDVTTRRLADAGVDVRVHVVDDSRPAAPAALLATLVESVRSRGTRPGTPPSGSTAPGSTTPGSTTPGTTAAADPTAGVDWLLARRTEAITTRSQALRQDVQALRMEVLQDLQRSLRDLGGRARDELAAAPRTRIDGIVDGIAADADAAVSGAVERADRRADALVVRHLGATAPTAPHIPSPTGGIAPSVPPRNRGEELLMLLMGAAGGTGVGRMLLSPLAEVPGLAVAVVPLALLCGLALGWTTVRVRRTQSLRTHSVAAVGDRLAALRGEAEQALGSRILAAEAIITDGFAHDPGPRVADLERRVRRLRSRGNTPAAPAAVTVTAPASEAQAPPVPTGSPSP